MSLIQHPAQSRSQTDQVAQGFVQLNSRTQSQIGDATTPLDNLFVIFDHLYSELFSLIFNYNFLCCNLCPLPLPYHGAINNVSHYLINPSINSVFLGSSLLGCLSFHDAAEVEDVHHSRFGQVRAS